MDRTPLPGSGCTRSRGLLDLVRAQEQQHASLVAAHDEEIRRLEAELDAQRKTSSEQADELDSRKNAYRTSEVDGREVPPHYLRQEEREAGSQARTVEFELEEDETTHAEAEAIAEWVSPRKEAKPRSERKPLPEHLKREEKMHKPDCDCCPDCGGGLRHFGDDVSEQLEHVPESFKVIRHVRPKFACTGCDRVVAPAPSRPIERGLAAPNLLAHVIVSKYADHLPLFRQSEIYARQGVQISGSTMAGWVGAASNLLGPLVNAIGRHVFAGRKLHADDTPMPVLALGNGKTKTGRLWTYVRDDRPAGEQAARAV